MNTTSLRSLLVTLLTIGFLSGAQGAVVTINGQTNGPTPFIKRLNLTVSPAAALDRIDFKIYPKPGSETRPVYVRYSAAHLQSLGLYNPSTGVITVSVFGLYADYNNRVALVSTFVDQTSQRDDIAVQAPVWNDPSNLYKTPAIAKPRTPNTTLSYDFVLARNTTGNMTPVILDTDGEVRWVGTANTSSQSAIFFNGAIYVYSGTTILRMRFDGTVSAVVDLASQGVTGYHHNFDYGKTGILVETDTTHASDPNLNQIESTIFEIGGNGAILKRWNFAKTFRDAILEDATQDAFVRNRGQSGADWFHNNSATYRPSDNTLIASAREDFVVAVDYDTGVLKWILGDTTKQWYANYPSLRPYALTADPNVVPIGQHAVRIRRDRLTVFDNGEPSFNHTPAGANRNFSVARKYFIDTIGNTATQIWSYNPNPTLDAPICSSVYEDASQNYLINYATITQLIGLDSSGNRVFDYRYPNTGACSTIYNAIPIHLENLRFN